MADFIQNLDASKLMLFETVLSFVAASFTTPSYNLPIFLFGIMAQELPDAPQSVRAFIALLGGSIMFDIIWMIQNEQAAPVRFLTIVILIVKLPTWLAFANSVRQAGGSFGNLSIGGHDISGATVWSMPGGFTSSGRNGYQNVDEPAPNVQVSRPSPNPAPPNPPATGGYQTV